MGVFHCISPMTNRLIAVLLALSVSGAPVMARSMEKECDRWYSRSVLNGGGFTTNHHKPETDPEVRVNLDTREHEPALVTSYWLVREAVLAACDGFDRYGFLPDKIYFFSNGEDLPRGFHVQWSSSGNYWILRKPWDKEYRVVLDARCLGCSGLIYRPKQ